MLANERKRKIHTNQQAEADSSDEELEDFLFGNSNIIKATKNSDGEEEAKQETATDDLLSFSISTKPSYFDGEKFVEEKDDIEKVLYYIINTKFLFNDFLKKKPNTFYIYHIYY